MSPMSHRAPFRLSSNSVPPWLAEIHRKLWGKTKLFGEIFRTANLTEQDFIGLQAMLQVLNPERVSESYDAEDVLAMKSGFLRSRSTPLARDTCDGIIPRLRYASQPLSSDVVGGGCDDAVVANDDVVTDDDDDDEDYEDDDDEDDEDDEDSTVDDDVMDIDPGHIDTHLANLSAEDTPIFPYTIRYMDLTVLHLTTTYSRVSQLMLFRNEWDTMIDIFNKTRHKGIRGSAIFTGHSGIGKTCLLHSILILCIICAQPIAFQDVYGRVFIIDNTVRPLGSTRELAVSTDVLTLVDGGGHYCLPDDGLLEDSKYRILLTSPLNANRRDRSWLTQVVKNENAMYMMELWSREELVIAGLFLESTDITLGRLQEASRVCGNIPRRCFLAATSSTNLYQARVRIKTTIIRNWDLARAIIGVMLDGDSDADCAFQIRPSSKNRFPYSCLVEPVSVWALEQMLDELKLRGKNEAYKLYRTVDWIAPEICGKVFENWVHPFLQGTRNFTIKSLDDHSTLDIDFTSNPYKFTKMENLSTHLISCVENNKPCYFQSTSPVHPTFLFQPTISQLGFSPFIALQVTTADNPTLNIKGLEAVHNSLYLRDPRLRHLRPIKGRKMIILFVVPVEETAKVQSIKAETGVNVERWYEKTAQYILKLSAKEVFTGNSLQ